MPRPTDPAVTSAGRADQTAWYEGELDRAVYVALDLENHRGPGYAELAIRRRGRRAVWLAEHQAVDQATTSAPQPTHAKS